MIPKVVMLEVTLKKAADLSRAALEAAEAPLPSPMVSYSVHSTADAAGLVDSAKNKIDAAIQKTRALLLAGYAIRDLIGKANAECGISEAMTKRKQIDAMIKLLGSHKVTVDIKADAELETLPSVIASAKVRLESGRGYGGESRVELRATTQAQVDQLEQELQSLKRERSDVVERIAALNVTHGITLMGDTEQTLHEAGLIG